VILFVAAATPYVWLVRAGYNHQVSPWISVPLQAVLTFVLFTPNHDASHSSISRKYRWLNDAIGWLSALSLLGVFPPFRWIHLQHHKYTNHPEKDPDHYAGSGDPRFRVFRWLTQDMYYYYFYFQNRHERPRGEVFLAFASMIGIHLTIGWLLLNGYFWDTVLHLLLPKMIGLTWLVYAFDYAPHHPHDHNLRENPYLVTNRLTGLFSVDDGISLAFPLLNQHLHNIHHLYQQVPFYRYHLIWKKHEKEFIAAGTPSSSLF